MTIEEAKMLVALGADVPKCYFAGRVWDKLQCIPYEGDVFAVGWARGMNLSPGTYLCGGHATDPEILDANSDERGGIALSVDQQKAHLDTV